MASADVLEGKIHSRIPAWLVSTQIAVTTDSIVYTVPKDSAVEVAKGSIANVSGSACTVGLSLVPAGASPDASHKVIPDTYSLGAGDSLPLGDFAIGMLGEGDSIAVHAGTANALDVVISGYVIT
jgi:hypothetical protein